MRPRHVRYHCATHRDSRSRSNCFHVYKYNRFLYICKLICIDSAYDYAESVSMRVLATSWVSTALTDFFIGNATDIPTRIGVGHSLLVPLPIRLQSLIDPRNLSASGCQGCMFSPALYLRFRRTFPTSMWLIPRLPPVELIRLPAFKTVCVLPLIRLMTDV